MSRYACLTVPAVMLVLMPPAWALELDSLLPAGVSGFANFPDVTFISRLQHGDQIQGIEFAGVTVSPSVSVGIGYDSAPNGAAGGSAALNFAPSVLIADKTIGFGAFAGLQTNSYPQNSAQDGSNYTIAIGEKAVLPQNTINFAAALLRSQQTGFALEPTPTPAATSLTGTALRASDDFASGMIILTPELSYIRASSNAAAGQSATETAAGVKLQIIPDGVLHIIAYAHASHLAYSAASQNGWNTTGLIGISDDEEGLWNFRLLGGFTARAPATGAASTLPVIEAAADWMPDDLTSLEFSAAHEIDDPDRIDTASYTITEAKLSIAHEYLRNIILTAGASVTHAAFFATPLIETITQTDAAIAWRLNSTLKFSADYEFNDRQANHLRAANEHVATLSLAWRL